MAETRIYLDNHSTTCVDPSVVEAIVPYMTEMYGNPGSLHVFGEEARAVVETSRELIANAVNASSSEIVFTSGATESNNLAIRGVAAKHVARGKHIVTISTEHRAVLDPIARLGKSGGFDVTVLPVRSAEKISCGELDLDQLKDALRDDTILVSVMLGNNEIGVIHPIAKIAKLCHDHETLLHCDATQAVGKVAVDVRELDVDLMSFSAHKIYGPRGIGALFVRRRPRVKMEAQIDGGAQQMGRRSGTLNAPGIVGFAKAVELCMNDLQAESKRISALREHLWRRLSSDISNVHLNGPNWVGDSNVRLAGTLNVRFECVDAESLMLRIPEIAVSTGSACTAEDPEPSHVLLALGCSEDQARSSVRFGIGRFNTLEEIDRVADRMSEAVVQLRRLGGG